MGDKLLTQQNLADRWQVSKKAIENWRKEGIIVPVKGLPVIRFNLSYIEQIEGHIPERITLRERKLERELEEITKERDALKSILANILAEGSKVFNISGS